MYRLLSLCAVLLAIPASAAGSRPSTSASHWSVLTGQTVGSGNNIFFAQAGFPGVSAAYLHGNSSTMDFGGIFAFDYGVEGATDFIDPELKFQAALRFNLGHKDKLNFGLEIDPGLAMLFVNTGSSSFHIGPTIPIKLVAGLKVNRELNVDFGLDTGFTLLFVDVTQFYIPIMFGGGLEYFINPDLAVTLNIRMGPVIGHSSFNQCGFGGCISGSSTGTSFGMSSEIGIALPMNL